MNKREKRQLVFLLKKIKKDMLKNWPKDNILYEIKLSELNTYVDDIIYEIECQLKENYSFKDLK